MIRLLLAGLVYCGLAGLASAVDLSKIDRGIAKEPVYGAKGPKYCLLVFGPKAETRVWLALDGRTLYVDRNADGDLTGEKVEARQHPQIMTALLFKTSPLTANGLPKDTRLEVMLEYNPRRKAHLVIVSCLADGRPSQRAAADPGGLLAFADDRKSAPIIHFHGPLTMSPHGKDPLTPGSNEEWEAVVGTPGLGAGSFARVANDAVPAKAHPVAEFEFRLEGDKSKRVTVVLDGRC